MDTLKSYYDQGVNTASGYLDSIKGLKLEEKAKWVNICRTYYSVACFPFNCSFREELDIYFYLSSSHNLYKQYGIKQEHLCFSVQFPV